MKASPLAITALFAIPVAIECRLGTSHFQRNSRTSKSSDRLIFHRSSKTSKMSKSTAVELPSIAPADEPTSVATLAPEVALLPSSVPTSLTEVLIEESNKSTHVPTLAVKVVTPSPSNGDERLSTESKSWSDTFHRRDAVKDSSSESFSLSLSLESTGASDEASSSSDPRSSPLLFSSSAAVSPEPIISQNPQPSSALFSIEQSPAPSPVTQNLFNIHSHSEEKIVISNDESGGATYLFTTVLLAVSVCGSVILLLFLRSISRKFAKVEEEGPVHSEKVNENEISTGVPSAIWVMPPHYTMASPIDEVEAEKLAYSIGILPFPASTTRRLSKVLEESSIDYECE